MSLSLAELGRLENMVVESTQSVLGKKAIKPTAELDGIQVSVGQEVEKIKALIIQEVLEFSKLRDVELFVRCYQIAATELIDRLYLLFKPHIKAEKSTPDFVDKILKNILSLIIFLEDRFARFFDTEEKIPDLYQTLIREELVEGVKSLKEIPIEKHSEQIVRDQVKRRLTSINEAGYLLQLTYRDVRFYKNLSSELRNIGMWQKERGRFSGFVKLLIFINFNEREFVNELLSEVDDELNAVNDLIDKIDLLSTYSKEINQFQIRKDFALLANYPSVKDQVISWIAEELSYLEQKFFRFQVPGTIHLRNSKEANQKIVCHLPVDQIGIFFRAATDIKLITTPSQRFLFEQVAQFVSTPLRAKISADSMRSKSYSPEKKDLEAVKDILMKLFRQIASY